MGRNKTLSLMISVFFGLAVFGGCSSGGTEKSGDSGSAPGISEAPLSEMKAQAVLKLQKLQKNLRTLLQESMRTAYTLEKERERSRA